MTFLGFIENCWSIIQKWLSWEIIQDTLPVPSLLLCYNMLYLPSSAHPLFWTSSSLFYFSFCPLGAFSEFPLSFSLSSFLGYSPLTFKHKLFTKHKTSIALSASMLFFCSSSYSLDLPLHNPSPSYFFLYIVLVSFLDFCSSSSFCGIPTNNSLPLSFPLLFCPLLFFFHNPCLSSFTFFYSSFTHS